MADPELTEPCDLVPTCPICKSGAMRLAHSLRDVTICVCIECHTTLSVPNDALRAFQQDPPER